jgi:hypothetical protein
MPLRFILSQLQHVRVYQGLNDLDLLVEVKVTFYACYQIPLSIMNN